ncbi:MAG: rhodanese [Desulfobacteraceae bacterium 4572_88]|nr:MAG: rhodanese [Desulfobacteraceae bacterium 4572_88]
MKNTKMTFPALIAIAVTIGALWFTNRSVTPKEAAWEDVVTEAEMGGYKLISTDELWKHYDRKPEGLLIADVRQEWEYRTGHIKGALNFPMESTWFSRWRKKESLAAFMGPDKDRLIVFY